MLEETLLSFALTGAGWVLWLLVALSVACVAVAIERAVSGALNRTPQEPLRKAMAEFAASRDAAGLGQALALLRGAEARVLGAAARLAHQGIPSVEEGLAAAAARERLRMDRYLAILGTVGSNAPFIGLFGTVLGIIRAFHDLALNEAEAASAVMAGISEALVATAVGLMVAIPAVVLYNTFQRANRRTLSRLDSLAHVFLAHLKATPDLGRKGA